MVFFDRPLFVLSRSLFFITVPLWRYNQADWLMTTLVSVHRNTLLYHRWWFQQPNIVLWHFQIHDLRHSFGNKLTFTKLCINVSLPICVYFSGSTVPPEWKLCCVWVDRQDLQVVGHEQWTFCEGVSRAQGKQKLSRPGIFKLFFGPPPLGEKGSYDYSTGSSSVGQ